MISDITERTILASIAWASVDPSDWERLSPLLLGLDPEHFSTDLGASAYRWAVDTGRTRPLTTDVVAAECPPAFSSALILDWADPPLLSEPSIKAACERITRRGVQRMQREALQAAASARTPEERDNALGRFYVAGKARSESATVGTLAALGLDGLARDVADELTGVPRLGTGFDAIDQALGSFRSGGLFMLGARTSSGKTAFCLTVGLQMAARGVRTGLVSCEDNEHRLGERLMAHVLEASSLEVRELLRKIKAAPQGALSSVRAQNTTLYDRVMRLSVGKLDAPTEFACAHPSSATLSVVESECRSLVLEHGAKLLLVDYVQAIRLEDSGSMDRKDQLHTIAARLKELAHHLGVPLILTSQLRRPPEKQVAGEPQMHDLRGAGELEEIGEWLALMWRDEQGRTCFKLEKNKQGPVGGRWELVWSRGHLTFCDAREVQC